MVVIEAIVMVMVVIIAVAAAVVLVIMVTAAAAVGDGLTCDFGDDGVCSNEDGDGDVMTLYMMAALSVADVIYTVKKAYR